MTRRPFGRVNCSNAMRPACAESTPGMSSSKTNNWRMGSGLHGKKRESVGFEDSLLLLFRKRQGQELIDVLPEVFHARAGPIGAPEHALGDPVRRGKYSSSSEGGMPDTSSLTFP